MKILAKTKVEALEKTKEFIAGIVLKGYEVRSIRNSTPSLRNVFCRCFNHEVFVINFKLSNCLDREKKLLLNKREINKLINFDSILVKELLEINGFFKIKIIAGKKIPIYRKKQEKEDKRMNEIEFE